MKTYIAPIVMASWFLALSPSWAQSGDRQDLVLKKVASKLDAMVNFDISGKVKKRKEDIKTGRVVTSSELFRLQFDKDTGKYRFTETIGSIEDPEVKQAVTEAYDGKRAIRFANWFNRGDSVVKNFEPRASAEIVNIYGKIPSPELYRVLGMDHDEILGTLIEKKFSSQAAGGKLMFESVGWSLEVDPKAGWITKITTYSNANADGNAVPQMEIVVQKMDIIDGVSFPVRMKEMFISRKTNMRYDDEYEVDLKNSRINTDLGQAFKVDLKPGSILRDVANSKEEIIPSPGGQPFEASEVEKLRDAQIQE